MKLIDNSLSRDCLTTDELKSWLCGSIAALKAIENDNDSRMDAIMRDLRSVPRIYFVKRARLAGHFDGCQMIGDHIARRIRMQTRLLSILENGKEMTCSNGSH